MFYRDRSLDELAAYRLPQSQFLALQGMQVHYCDEGQGPVLLLLHGLGDSLHTWAAWVAYLKADFRIIRLDLPGFGLTGPHPEDDYSLPASLQFLNAFAEALNLSAFHLAGSSLGGYFAWQWALEAPEKIQSLCLISAAGFTPPNRSKSWVFRLARWPLLRQSLRWLTPRWMIRRMLREVFYENSWVKPDLVARYHELLLRAGNRRALSKRLVQSYPSDTSPLKELPQATLLLWGRQDPWISVRDASFFRQVLPQAQLSVYNKVGHLPMVEQAWATAEDLRQFVQGLSENNKI